MQPQNERRAAPFAVTVGEGKKNPQGIYTPCEPSVLAVAEVLRQQPPEVERWWSMHLWQKNKRAGKAWLASCGIIVDIDYHSEAYPPVDLVEKLRNAAATRDLPGALFHLTPHGARIVWVYGIACSDREVQMKAERGAGVLTTKALEKLELTDYKVDTGILGDLARFFYTPTSEAKGVKRSDEVFVIRKDLSNPVDLTPFDVAVRPVEQPKTQTVQISAVFATATERWNNDHPGNWPKNSAPCPICSDSASFGRLPEDPTRWHCFSTDHSAIGVKGALGYHGDALDMEAFRRNCKPIDILRTDGYLGKRSEPPPRKEEDVPFDANDLETPLTDGDTVGEAPTTEGKPATIISISQTKPVGAWQSRSYCTVVQILEQNARDVLEGRKIELNEMSGDTEIGRKPIKDADAYRIRYLIEARFKGGVSKQGNQMGMQFSAADIFAAINQVAHERPYHPVQQYLTSLKWDRQPYIERVVGMLGADQNEINQILVKRFFISAVARPLKPGCKVDTVFILVGKQGARKSSFFDTLSNPWFVDTPIDISGDAVRAYMTLRKAWLLEWAELEAMLRAKRYTTVKAFLSSGSDSYVPKHARYNIQVPRGGVIVGTTNTTEFLEDDTGERRYWPLSVGNIDLKGIAAIRDQLWAEAVALFQADERWWLTEDEERLLAPRHSEHRVADVWAERVLGYAAKQPPEGFTTADVLREEIVKEVGQWNRGDEMRIAKILKAYGYNRVTDSKNTSRKVWKQ